MGILDTEVIEMRYELRAPSGSWSEREREREDEHEDEQTR